MFMVSKALLMSSDTRTVREGGLGSLKPLDMVLVILCSAVTVEWFVLKPCCLVW